MRLAGGQLEITPSRQLLEDPATVFPVLIDPFFSTSNWPWAYADQSMRMDLQEFRRNALVNPVIQLVPHRLVRAPHRSRDARDERVGRQPVAIAA
jgi:hypothetical protein